MSEMEGVPPPAETTKILDPTGGWKKQADYNVLGLTHEENWANENLGLVMDVERSLVNHGDDENEFTMKVVFLRATHRPTSRDMLSGLRVFFPNLTWRDVELVTTRKFLTPAGGEVQEYGSGIGYVGFNCRVVRITRRTVEEWSLLKPVSKEAAEGLLAQVKKQLGSLAGQVEILEDTRLPEDPG